MIEETPDPGLSNSHDDNAAPKTFLPPQRRILPVLSMVAV
jgi:hypothetical protein